MKVRSERTRGFAALACTLAVAMLLCPGFLGQHEAAAATSPSLAPGAITESVSTQLESQSTTLAPQADAVAVQTRDQAVDVVRQAMVKRQSPIAISMPTATWRKMSASTSASQIVLDAFGESGEPYAGDYLRFSLKASGDQPALQIGISTAGITTTITYTVLYNTAATQEATAAQRIDAAYATISSTWTGSTGNLQKVRDIHDWICKNVAYDTSYSLTSYSAYGAIVNHRAVCQGYSSLFYALATKAGLKTRIIGGIGVQGKNTEDHAWNIVSLDGGATYHNIDTTWDSSYYHSGGDWHRYFLNNSTVFANSHVRGAYWTPYENYASAEFESAHATSKYTYVAASAATCTQAALKEHWRGNDSNTLYRDANGATAGGISEFRTGSALGHSWGAWKVTKAATYTATGLRSHTCSRCKSTETQAIAKLVATRIGVPGAAKNLRYNGRQQTGVAANARYTISGNTATRVGTYTATVKPKTGYVWSNGSSGAVKVRWTIAKANNPMTAAPAAKQLKASRSRATTFATGKAFRVTKNQGAVSYAKVKGTGYVTVAKNGKVTVKKGARRGTYTIRVRVIANGNASYNASTKYVNLKIRVV